MRVYLSLKSRKKIMDKINQSGTILSSIPYAKAQKEKHKAAWNNACMLLSKMLIDDDQ